MAVLACISLAGGCALSACGAATEAAVVPAAQVNTAPVGPARAVPARAVPAPAVLPRVSVSRMEADGSVVTIATFRGPVRYSLYDGGEDPYARPGLLRDQSAVAASERRQLLAAFNGGFKMVADAGGYEQEGHLLYPLRPGLASLVISRAGKAGIGVWGKSVPVPGEAVYSVRQNLQPLVLDGRPTAASSDWGLWGATLGGGEYVARSALGEAADGNLMYAGSMSATPYDLAYALARSGARSAMELDINPAWVQLDVARRPGGALRAKVYEQYRPADQYLYGWTRDFIAVFGDLRVLMLFPGCADACSGGGSARARSRCHCLANPLVARGAEPGREGSGGPDYPRSGRGGTDRGRTDHRGPHRGGPGRGEAVRDRTDHGGVAGDMPPPSRHAMRDASCAHASSAASAWPPARHPPRPPRTAPRRQNDRDLPRGRRGSPPGT
jgi:hypothetical protein